MRLQIEKQLIDNEGEDYLYPSEYFIFVDFPPTIKRALLQTSSQAQHQPFMAFNNLLDFVPETDQVTLKKGDSIVYDYSNVFTTLSECHNEDAKLD